MVSVISVNIAAPSPIISELGETTHGCKASFGRETCSLWLECTISQAGITLSIGFTNSVPVTGGVIPKEVASLSFVHSL